MRTDTGVTTPLISDKSRCQNLATLMQYQWYALSYGIPTASTYFISIDRWPQHMKWMADYISTLDTPWQKAVFAGVMMMTINLGLSNQRVMPEKIAQMHGQQLMSLGPACSKRYVAIDTALSASWKSFVSATSYWALNTDWFNYLPIAVNVSQGVSLIPTLIGLLPNLLAQYVNFSDDSLVLMRKIAGKHPEIFAWVCAFLYALQQAALYFNTGNKVVPFVSGNLSDLDTLVKKILFGLNASLSIHLLAGTTYSYANNIFWSLTQASAADVTVSPGSPRPNGQLEIADNSGAVHYHSSNSGGKWLNTSMNVNALFKTFITLAAFYALGDSNPVLKYIFLTLCVLFIPGNFLTQKALFKLKGPSICCSSNCCMTFSRGTSVPNATDSADVGYQRQVDFQ